MAHHARLYVWTKAACPPLQLPLFSPDLGRESSECDQWRANTISRIQALKPSLVVLGIAPNDNSAYHITEYGAPWLAGLTSTIGAVRQNVQPWFCTATSCPAIVGNLLVFPDNSHITVPFANYVAPLMADELQLAASSG